MNVSCPRGEQCTINIQRGQNVLAITSPNFPKIIPKFWQSINPPNSIARTRVINLASTFQCQYLMQEIFSRNLQRGHYPCYRCIHDKKIALCIFSDDTILSSLYIGVQRGQIVLVIGHISCSEMNSHKAQDIYIYIYMKIKHIAPAFYINYSSLQTMKIESYIFSKKSLINWFYYLFTYLVGSCYSSELMTNLIMI